MHSVYDIFNRLGKKLGLISSYDWRYIYHDQSYRLARNAPTLTQETEIKKLCKTGVLEAIEGSTFLSSLYKHDLISFASYRKYNEYFRLSDLQVSGSIMAVFVQAVRGISYNNRTHTSNIAPFVLFTMGANFVFYQREMNKYKDVKNVNFDVFPKDENDNSLLVVSKQKNHTLLFDQRNERLISKIENRNLERKDRISFRPLSQARFGMQAGTLPWFFDRYYENFPPHQRYSYIVNAFIRERFFLANLTPVTSRNFYESLTEALYFSLYDNLIDTKLSIIDLAVKVAGAVNTNTVNASFPLNDLERKVGSVKHYFMPFDYYMYNDSGVCFEKTFIFVHVMRELRASNLFVGDMVVLEIDSKSCTRYFSKLYEKNFPQGPSNDGHVYCMIFPPNELPIIIDCMCGFAVQFKNYESFKEYIDYVHLDTKTNSSTSIEIVTNDDLKTTKLFGVLLVDTLLGIYEKNQTNKAQSKLRM